MNVIFYIAIYLIGFISGWYLHKYYSSKEQNEKKAMFKNLIAFLITLAWVASILSEIFISDFHTNFFVHGIMGAVAGYLFGPDAITKVFGRKNG